MLERLLLLNALLLIGLALLLPFLAPRDPRWRVPLLFFLLLVIARYAWWRGCCTLPDFAWSAEELWQYGFWGTEMLGLIYAAWQAVVFLRRRDRRADADHGEALLRRSPASAPRVDLLIPTYNEGPDILEPTIRAATAIDYPAYRVWICDDGSRDWLRILCARHDVGYIRRSEHQHGKGGNLDHAIAHTDGDLVAVIDADFIALPNMLYRLAALLRHPHIGLVQAPQHFRNADPIQRNLSGRDAWTEEQRLFFDVALPARDAWDNALCVGSCWMARRAVFTRLGGYPTGSIVEDVYLGYAVKALGWHTAYLDEPVALGLAPEDLPTYIRQRTRWGQGALTLLSARWGPLRAPRLSLLDRCFYLDLPLYWLGHPLLLLILLAPLVYGFTGTPAFHCNLEDLFGQVVPRLLLSAAIMFWVTEGRAMPLITPISKMITLFHVLPAIALGLARPDHATFKVSAKGDASGTATVHWGLMLPFLILGALTVIAIAMTFTQEFARLAWSDYSAFNAMLGAYSLISLFLCCLACVERPPTAAEHCGPQHITGSLQRTATALWRRLSE